MNSSAYNNKFLKLKPTYVRIYVSILYFNTNEKIKIHTYYIHEKYIHSSYFTYLYLLYLVPGSTTVTFEEMKIICEHEHQKICKWKFSSFYVSRIHCQNCLLDITNVFYKEHDIVAVRSFQYVSVCIVNDDPVIPNNIF